ncbi:hypothetical protein KEH51_05250 [[Brevibacterium] frigoritolerans]|uniref:Uncharacterized protein n=1 Tax=Peribacillus frigoritolerans TaxID=450367 RepID=A0A941FHU0_9BACI|nr:hypothetical protein [Peribacillus frigoritolerans]
MGQEEGYQPSTKFKENFPYKESDRLYKEFIAPRVEKDQHTAAHSIYEAEHYSNLDIPQERSDNIFSFIPLFEDKGEFLLIDILPLLQDLNENNLISKVKKYPIKINYIVLIFLQ